MSKSIKNQVETPWQPEKINLTLRKLAIVVVVVVVVLQLKISLEKFDIFAQNIDCGYTIEPPR